MIAEDYVGFETRNLLWQKGMPKDCFNHLVCENTQENTVRKYYTCSLYKAMKWLREIYNFHICVSVGTDESSDADGKIVEEWSFWTFLIESTYGNIIYDACAQFDPIEYQSYEEACEAAIKYVLENLI